MFTKQQAEEKVLSCVYLEPDKIMAGVRPECSQMLASRFPHRHPVRQLLSLSPFLSPRQPRKLRLREIKPWRYLLLILREVPTKKHMDSLLLRKTNGKNKKVKCPYRDLGRKTPPRGTVSRDSLPEDKMSSTQCKRLTCSRWTCTQQGITTWKGEETNKQMDFQKILGLMAKGGAQRLTLSLTAVLVTKL